MPLVAHLGDHLIVLLGFLRQQAHLVDRVTQRLLAIDVLALLDGMHGRGEVNVIGRRDGHSVDLVPDLVEHLPR